MSIALYCQIGCKLKGNGSSKTKQKAAEPAFKLRGKILDALPSQTAYSEKLRSHDKKEKNCKRADSDLDVFNTITDESRERTRDQSDTDYQRQMSCCDSVQEGNVLTSLTGFIQYLRGQRNTKRNSLYKSTSPGHNKWISKQPKQQVNCYKTQSSSSTRRKAKIMFIILVIYVIMLYYLTIMILASTLNGFYEEKSEIEHAMRNVFVRSYFINCGINPFLFILCDSRLKGAGMNFLLWVKSPFLKSKKKIHVPDM